MIVVTDLGTLAEDRLRNEVALEEHRDEPLAVDIVTVLGTLAALRARLAEAENRAHTYHRALFVVRTVEGEGCEHGIEVACVRCETVLVMEKRGECGCAPEYGPEHWPDCPLREVTTRADAQTVLIELVRAVNGVEAVAPCAAARPAR